MRRLAIFLIWSAYGVNAAKSLLCICRFPCNKFHANRDKASKFLLEAPDIIFFMTLKVLLRAKPHKKCTLSFSTSGKSLLIEHFTFVVERPECRFRVLELT